VKTQPSVLDTQLKHVSVRSFLDREVSDDMLQQIIDGARRAPTSSNMQAYSIIVVRDENTRLRLSELTGHQKHVAQAPVFLAFCADLNRLGVATALNNQVLQSSLETFVISTVDAALVGMNAMTAAESLGLGGVMIGAVRNHPKEVGDLLALPTGVYVVFGMAIGWPDTEQFPTQKPRLPENLVVHSERYDASGFEAGIQEYDAQLSEYYGRKDKGQSGASWSGPLARGLSKTLRPELLRTLEEMGFKIR
jgi:FMN reductase (NADPH)